MLGEPVGDVAVGEDLVVRDEHHHLHPQLLQPHAIVNGAEVVPEMQPPRRTVPGQHAEPPGVRADRFLQYGTAALGRGHAERIRGNRGIGRDGGVEMSGHSALLFVRWSAAQTTAPLTGENTKGRPSERPDHVRVRGGRSYEERHQFRCRARRM